MVPIGGGLKYVFCMFNSIYLGEGGPILTNIWSNVLKQPPPPPRYIQTGPQNHGKNSGFKPSKNGL